MVIVSIISSDKLIVKHSVRSSVVIGLSALGEPTSFNSSGLPYS